MLLCFVLLFKFTSLKHECEDRLNPCGGALAYIGYTLIRKSREWSLNLLYLQGKNPPNLTSRRVKPLTAALILDGGPNVLPTGLLWP